MSNSKLKQIKDVVRNFDVRDPRGAMEAIEKIINAKSLAPKEPKASLSIKVIDVKDVGIQVILRHSDNIDPAIVLAAKEAINQFGQNKFGNVIRDADSGELLGFEKFGDHKGITQISGPDCDCPACRLKALLEEVRAKIESERAEGSQDDLPAGAVFQTEVDGAKATDANPNISATDSGTN